MLVEHAESGVEADHLAGDRAEAAVGEQRDRGADVLGLENPPVNRLLRQGCASVVVEKAGCGVGVHLLHHSSQGPQRALSVGVLVSRARDRVRSHLANKTTLLAWLEGVCPDFG
ncbi:hypothetical protein [Amycolatopsis sp. SID8362]|uniref:hypothetical protein n=1 Tax=Amycolatopsis sp. SID8362 TaxID=2690346 RepID=UPI0013689469|nr:hypothetical protein [Amycolatopsis sp. SID8362]NBH05315.1 hypothetical protein [Amycolatopsis sp. SID8362]NED42015.1 hypothetical protein [Amycolatopsis sp. SID8362]